MRSPLMYPAIGIIVSVAVVAQSASADIFYVKTGGSIEGDLIEKTDEMIRIRAMVGPLELPLDFVVRIESRPSLFAEYDQRSANLSDEAEQHFQLAEWCAKKRFHAERRKHLQRTIELNSEHVGARKALGFVKVAGVWIENPKPRPSASVPSEEEDAPQGEELARAIQGQWYARISSIRASLLDRASAKMREDGRKRILDIKDPLAVAPMCRVLGAGNEPTRLLLVEALCVFTEDEATLNLLALAMLDDSLKVREEALAELRHRNDIRLSQQVRQALRSNSDVLIRRAAAAAGELRMREAIPELIDVLQSRKRKLVEVRVEDCRDQFADGWGTAYTQDIGGNVTIRYMPVLAIPGGSIFDNVQTERQPRVVTVFRTEAMEALKAITGQNFGFESDEWRRWHEESRR